MNYISYQFFGTVVATKTGANPEISLDEIDKITKQF